MTHHPHHRLGERNLRIGVKIWLFFMLFVCVVFLLMWLFQVIFLEWFYESMKIRDTAKLAQQLVSDYGSDDFSQDAQEISLQNEMCIELLNTNGREVYYNCVYNGKCLLHGEGKRDIFLSHRPPEQQHRHDLPQGLQPESAKSDAGLRLHHVQQG